MRPEIVLAFILFVLSITFIIVLAWALSPNKVNATKQQSRPNIDINSIINKKEIEKAARIHTVIFELTKKLIIPAFKMPNEFIYFFLSITRRLLMQRGYPTVLVDGTLIAVIENLKIKDLSSDIFAQRDCFYYNLPKSDEKIFFQNVLDIIKASQYLNFENKIDMFEVRDVLLKSGLGILEDCEMHTKFTTTFKVAFEFLDKEIEQYKK